MRRTLASGVAIAAALFLLTLAAHAARRRGAPARAKTIASRTGLSPRESEQALLLLKKAREELPAGAAVVFVNDRKPQNGVVNYAVAVGQLPAQRVLPAEAIHEAQYVVLLHGAEGGEIVRRR
jgi:hypothetical protein